MTAPSRARPLAPEQRREAILDAVIPLLLEHGASLTSRQIAEAAGIAEGTVYRAFADKESLLDAAAQRYLSASHEHDGPLPDPEASLEDTVAFVLAQLRERVRGVMRMAAVTGRQPAPPDDKQRALFEWRVREAFERYRAELGIDLVDLGAYLRAIAIASTIPALGPPFSDHDLARLVVRGIRANPTDRPED